MVPNKHTVGNSWDIFSMVTTIFSGVILVLSGDVVDIRFHIAMMMFIKGLQRYPIYVS